MAHRKLEVHPEALLEADAGLVWYLERSRGAGEFFHAELERAIDAILRTPLRSPPYLRGMRRYLLYKFPYSVVYQPVGERVLVYAFAHAKRRPGYWKTRLAWSGE
jgi:plasmid stabilization system protein ParE